MKLDQEQLNALAVLANAIFPADERDSGAASVDAAQRIAELLESSPHFIIYRNGIELAKAIARETFSTDIVSLPDGDLHALIGMLREQAPGFFKQMRMDVSAFYLSDPSVWQRIGFPGPSALSGGYLDFDQQQIAKADGLKEN